MSMKIAPFAIAITGLVLLISTLVLRADLIQADSPRYGQNALTIDTATRLAWLDLPFSTNMSYQQVIAATQVGGLFDGFRYATVQEVSTLYADAGIPSAGFYPESSSEGQSALSLISLLGATSYQDGRPLTLGISGTPDRFGRDVTGLDFGYANFGVPGYFVGSSGLVYGETFGVPTVGSWLVYEVPEPAAWLLGTMGGAWLIFASRMLRRPNAPLAVHCSASLNAFDP
jgi:hypothetical protein